MAVAVGFVYNRILQTSCLSPLLRVFRTQVFARTQYGKVPGIGDTRPRNAIHPGIYQKFMITEQNN